MKYFALLLFAIAACHAIGDKEDWETFRVKYNKSYLHPAEEQRRYNIFLSNLHTIEEHNKKYENGQSSFKMGVNHFADLTSEEFMESMKYSTRSKPTLPAKRAEFAFEGDLPTEVDWRKKGAVTEVKDQGSCGSCWSFSITGTVEGQNFLKTGKLLSFSEQQLVDCAKGECVGCDGGELNDALDYVVSNGLELEENYPYKEEDSTCKYNESIVAVKVKSYEVVKANDENELQKAVATKGPVSVAICASFWFQLYSSGVLDDSDCGNLPEDMNHAVLAVGYGTQDGTDYWIVKNSWGPTWGMDGYVLMPRNVGNRCGIANEPVVPVL
ncbi:hypothetical protein JTB14_017470 [Gonioctena quinquepunctata]|nr:hypothetical protein JTB14_017470 [Gonioctena quinquepunctata]